MNMHANKPAVKIGIIGGSGLGEALLEGLDPSQVTQHDIETPFGQTSAPLLAGQVGDVDIVMVLRHGDGHVIPPHRVPYRANVFALKSMGCTHVIASGACGSLQEHIAPGSLVLCDQFIDRTRGRDETFFDNAAGHVEFADPTCPVMHEWFMQAAGASRSELTVHESGTYVCMEGPSFSTRAESALHRQIGGHVVGMTAMPEARLVREAEMAYALVALPTDYDCWRPRPDGVDAMSLLQEIIGNLKMATQASIELIRGALHDVSILRATPSPAFGSLTLGLWSDKSKIDAEEIKKLAPIWGRHFDEC